MLYEVITGGATLQFAMVPANLMKNGVADYIVTGAWSKKAAEEAKKYGRITSYNVCYTKLLRSKKAAEEAKKYGKVNVLATSKDKNFSYVPDVSDLPISEDADYVYICENETIHGTTYAELPNTKGKILVSDQSSMFLSKPCNVSDYGMI